MFCLVFNTNTSKLSFLYFEQFLNSLGIFTLFFSYIYWFKNVHYFDVDTYLYLVEVVTVTKSSSKDIINRCMSSPVSLKRIANHKVVSVIPGHGPFIGRLFANFKVGLCAYVKYCGRFRVPIVKYPRSQPHLLGCATDFRDFLLLWKLPPESNP